MASAGVVEPFDILEDGGLGLPPCLPFLSPDEFSLQRFEECLHRGVVVTISLKVGSAELIRTLLKRRSGRPWKFWPFRDAWLIENAALHLRERTLAADIGLTRTVEPLHHFAK